MKNRLAGREGRDGKEREGEGRVNGEKGRGGKRREKKIKRKKKGEKRRGHLFFMFGFDWKGWVAHSLPTANI